VRRTYYLLQMPGWGRRLRFMIDWTVALLFPPDIVKIGLDSEAALILREAGPTTRSPQRVQPELAPKLTIASITLARAPESKCRLA
jgi:hypothetical protein